MFRKRQPQHPHTSTSLHDALGGHPPTMQTTTITPDPALATARTTTLRTAHYRPKRRRWPGVLAACVLGAGIGALAVSSYYDDRSVGQRLDATVQATQQSVAEWRDGASTVARDGVSAGVDAGSRVGERAASVLSDASITASVKTALAADPKLSAVKIDVDTQGGVVSLEGPAPDLQSRERAEILASAPEGVLRVDNRLVVTPPEATARVN